MTSTERSDFLEYLGNKYKANAIFVATQYANGRLSRDFLRNECVQAFLLKANHAIDTFRQPPPDSPAWTLEGWCKFKGLNGVTDFLRQELGVKRPENSRFVPADKIAYIGDFVSKDSGIEHWIGSEDPVDYAEATTAYLFIEKRLAKLLPIDRTIIELLLFGESSGIALRNASLYKMGKTSKPHRHVAHTLGVSIPYVASRLAQMRETFADLKGAL